MNKKSRWFVKEDSIGSGSYSVCKKGAKQQPISFWQKKAGAELVCAALNFYENRKRLQKK